MSRRGPTNNDQSRSDRPAALAGRAALSSALPAPNLVGHSVLETAKHCQVDAATIRRDIQRGCPVLRRGSKGPGRGAQLDPHAVEQWRNRKSPAGLSHDEVVQRIADCLLDSLTEDLVHRRAEISKAAAAAVLLIVWERCCASFGVTFKFDPKPASICALMREL